MQEIKMTIEEIKHTIKSAGDSVWVIEDTITKLNEGSETTKELKGEIERNVSHLKIVTEKQDIIDSGEDISSLINGIKLGEDKLAEDIWPAE